ncbi:MAG: DUF167 domain-containing protein [Armatimonadetes bacterium]|nr:DUF167 domain-containing protein [Armatimonadota bacterium]
MNPENGCEIQVRITPKSSLVKMERQPDGTIKAWVNAPPHGGEANSALVSLAAKTLGIPKSAVKLASGHKSRVKTLAIHGFSLDDVLQRIGEAGG